MIDLSNSVSVNNKSPFAPFLDSNGANYAILKPLNQSNDYNIPAPNVMPPEEKKSNALGFSIALTSIIAGFGVLALTKGIPKRGYKKLDGIFKYLESKTSSFKDNEKLTKMQNFSLIAIKKTKTFTKKLKSLFNMMVIKDPLIDRASLKIPGIKKFSVWLSNFYENVSEKFVKKSYAKTMSKFEDFYVEVAKHNVLISKTHPESAKEIQKNLQIIQSKLNEGFSGVKRNERLNETKKALTQVAQDIWDNTFGNVKKFVKDKRTYETYLAEEYAAPAKMKLSHEVDNYRIEITNDIKDNYSSMKRLLSEIDGFLDPTDKPTRELMKKLHKSLKVYKNLSGKQEAIERTNLSDEIVKDLGELSSYIKNSKVYDDNTILNVPHYIDSISNILESRTKGPIQEILTRYHNILPEKEYLQLKNCANEAIKSLDKSIDLETDKLFDKIRDIKLGSAPTDFIGILTSLGVVAWGLGKADNKEERVSVTLKYGIPAVGAVVTSIFCAVGMIAGGPSIVLGLLSGLAMHKIGEVVDESIKNYKQKKLSLSSINNIAKKITNNEKDLLL